MKSTRRESEKDGDETRRDKREEKREGRTEEKRRGR